MTNVEIMREIMLRTIGASETVTVSELIPLTDNDFAVDITSTTLEQTICLAFISKSYHEMSDGCTLFIRFFAKDCEQRISTPNQFQATSLRALSTMYNRALSNNPFYAFITKDLEDVQYENQLFVYLTPDVIQFFSDNPDDLFGNSNLTANDAFSQVLRSSFFGEIDVFYNTNQITYGQ